MGRRPFVWSFWLAANRGKWNLYRAGVSRRRKPSGRRRIGIGRLRYKRVLCLCHMWSSEGRHVGDAWAHGGDEGRGKLREARGSGTHAVIPRWPNGATRPSARTVITLSGVKRTRGTETSQYLEEEKSTEMSGVAASETDPSPNRAPCGRGVVGPADATGQAR